MGAHRPMEMPPPRPLDQAERTRLVRLERTVERAVDAMGKIAGDALATIHEDRLYRTTDPSFESYVLRRFGFSRATAYRMIAVARKPQIDPSEDETAGQHVSSRDSFDAPKPLAQASGTGRVWGTVARLAARGVVRVQLDDEAAAPPVGSRVEVVWTAS